ncbi:MAG: squalene synthase HpnC [Planctomycetota bacterium]|nr:squalene synthase HpnC [Planctomycetota bacterium]MDA1162666.1 squalene synthase HpnC [Planctomycetota bacterium]
MYGTIREDALRPVAEQVADWWPVDRETLAASRPALREAPSLDDANAYCRTLATGHYENFPLVSWLLPKGLHQHFYNVYSFCRWADDLGDEIGDTERSLKLLGWWRHELTESFAGNCHHPVFVALKPTIDEFDIPQQLFADLISAFEQDQHVLEYDTHDQVLDYCTRSANPVGRIVLHLCRQVSDQTFAWSDSICTGLQLANFWQDVDRDLAINRIYLPKEDRDRFGVAREDLFARRTTDEFLQLMEFEVGRARNLLNSGLPLVEVLPGPLQVDIELFARGGLCILDRIERIGFRVLETRPVVTRFDVLQMLTSCLFRAVVRKCRSQTWQRRHEP